MDEMWMVGPNGERRSIGQAVVAWWLGNWATARKIHTDEQLNSLARKIDELLDGKSG